MQCLVRFKCVSKNTDQEGKKTVYSFKAERIGPHTHTHTKKSVPMRGKVTEREGGGQPGRERERKSLLSLLFCQQEAALLRNGLRAWQLTCF